MTLELEIKDGKADFILELFSNFHFVEILSLEKDGEKMPFEKYLASMPAEEAEKLEK